MIRLSDFYKEIFGSKTYKLSLDASCTCPNRDGTKGKGGCIFCSESGSGEFAANRSLSIKEQVEKAKALVESKIRGRSGSRKGKYIAYFQNFTSTYGNAKLLAQKYKEALSCENVVALAIATRPDCIEGEILKEIAKIAEKSFVQIELGLQTSNEKTGKFINRLYTNDDYAGAVKRIKKANPKIHIVTHLIFGLPGDTEKDMLESVKFVKETAEASVNSLSFRAELSLAEKSSQFSQFYGIKITSLFVLKNTRLAGLYENGDFKALEKDEYISLLKKALPILGERCVVHRLTGDPPKSTLIAPLWTSDKKRVLNEISGILREKSV